MKITVVGLGYVGLANAILLSMDQEVVGIDVDKRKVDLVNQGKSPLEDQEIKDYLKNKKLNLVCKTEAKEDYKDSDLVIIAVPTNYDEENGYFDTSLVEKVIEDVKEVNEDVNIIIKSTIPIGFTEKMREDFHAENIYFSPEFLREGQALHDCLYPSRIIIGDKGDFGRDVAEIFKKGALNNPEIHLMNSTEAEAVKLFANTYLAMRVSYFNELDSFAELKGLDTKDIIAGVCSDPRIGDHYNNPSFGYGGYCLPKDSKQLYANFKDVPNAMFGAIVKANKVRKDFVSDRILSFKPKSVGIYRLTMKKDSDNFRKSAIFDVIENLKAKGIEIFVYEPTIKESEFEGLKIENDFEKFKQKDIIVANRLDAKLEEVKEKVYTRDIFKRD
jgi:UDPglucose 6-dehydrogenase